MTTTGMIAAATSRDGKRLARQFRRAEVNAALRAMMEPDDRRAWELVLRPDGRLRLRVEGTTGFDVDPAIRSSDGLWFAHTSRRSTGWGGTQEQALVQVVRWYRDLPRRPLAWWGWITRPQVNLGGPRLLEAISASTYAADGKTDCVLCGRPAPTDWWSRDGTTGPACRGVFDGHCPERNPG